MQRRRRQLAITGPLALLAALTAASAPGAEPFRVGRGGTHGSIQAALDEAVARGGEREIHVAAGHWSERIRLVFFEARDAEIRLIGGWGKGFADSTGDPTRTVLDGGGLGSVVTLFIGGDLRISLSGFTISGGTATSGGGVLAELTDRAQLTLQNTHIRSNLAIGPNAAGGGITAIVRNDARFSMSGCRLQRNSSQSAGAANSGGAHLAAIDHAHLDVSGNHFLENEALSRDNTGSGSALTVGTFGDASATIVGNTVERNRAVTTGGYGVVAVVLNALETGTRLIPRIVARRNQFLGNLGNGSGNRQVELRAERGGLVQLSDSLLALGNGAALAVHADEGGEIQLTNLTIARNSEAAVVTSGSGIVSLSNTIVFENGAEVHGSVVESHNFRGDPLFVDPAGDYHLRPGSPAIDAGDDSPPGGLSASDIDLDPRRWGAAVDIGADEAPTAIHGEPACSVPAAPAGWSGHWPFVSASVPACRCFSESDLLHARCGFFVDGLYVGVLVPLGWKAGDALVPRWTILPWEPVSGPYGMRAEALIAGRWVEQAWLGPSAPGLKDGEPVSEAFEWRPSGIEATPVRTTLEYARPGLEEPARVELEVWLPPAAR